MYLLMRKITAFVILFITTLAVHAQDSLGAIHDLAIKSTRTAPGKYELTITGNISGGWQVYAPNQVLLDVKSVELKFSDSAVVQDGDFILQEKPVAISNPLFESVQPGVFEKNINWKANITITGTVPANLQTGITYNYGKGEEFYSFEKTFIIPLEGGVEAETVIRIPSIDINNPVIPCGDDGTKGKSIFSIFLLGILGGFIALLTPCVFPMIPVTVTFFTKRSADRKKGITNAVLYGLFIFLIYTIITVPFHFAGAKSEVFNNISTNVWLNLFFFAIFVVFALSFFGLFEITLPSGIANKAGSKSGIGNIGGIFFMAATLAIVSFSCTGPILGTLLVGASSEGAWPLTAGAAGFGLALSLPFALFAMFPNWLQSLPKSGGWMTTVKVVLGFVEIALAVKFLANADNVKQWGIMKREIFVGLWVIIGLLTTLYLFGLLQKKTAGQKKRLSPVRLLFGLLFGAFTLYLVPGLTNTKYAGLKLLSGFPPPLSYSIYPDHVLHANGVKPIINDYKAALAKARAENKPLLIDFTGWACVNCRRMEEKVWTNHEVDSLMRTQFVVVSLYVDERTKLPLKDRITYTDSIDGEQFISTVGHKWTAFQKANFGAVSQPQYAIISPDQVALTKTKFYTPSPAAFKKWLECGLEAYRKK